MEQRRLRLGDTLDDYCPRERRVTNHAIVAMIEDDIKQTRCTTCDAEHPYKGAKVPRRRKPETPAALFREVLAGKPDDLAPVLAATASSVSAPVIPPSTSPHMANSVSIADDDLDDDELGDQEESQEDIDVEAADAAPVEEGPVHRQLIRATLPRIEGQKDERRPTEFTIRQPSSGRGTGSFRGGDSQMRARAGNGGMNGANGNGNRPHGGPRFSSARPSGPGPGRGAGRGGAPAGNFRGGQGQGQPRPGGGRKRSR